MFARIADALELKGETGYRVLAYRNAARALLDLTEDVARLADSNRLETLSGIGPGIGRKIVEYLASGHMKKYEEAVTGLPPALFDMLGIHGLGPKTVRLLYERLDVSSLGELRRVLSNGEAAALPSLGPRKAGNILRALSETETAAARMYLDEALCLAQELVDHIAGLPAAEEVSFAGSLRRGRAFVAPSLHTSSNIRG
jgi:DNA polymerase (family 10)